MRRANSKARPTRSPVAESILLLAGLALFFVATMFESGTLFLVSVFCCVFAGLAAVITLALAERGLAMQVAATVFGSIAAVFGAYWMTVHGDEPEIFSPSLVLYPGGGLALSGALNLLYRVPFRRVLTKQQSD